MAFLVIRDGNVKLLPVFPAPATTLDRGPDFVRLAEAYGLKGFRATTRAEVEQALAAALDAGCGAIIDCQLDIDEMVRPMVAAGAPITDFLLKEATT